MPIVFVERDTWHIRAIVVISLTLYASPVFAGQLQNPSDTAAIVAELLMAWNRLSGHSNAIGEVIHTHEEFLNDAELVSHYQSKRLYRQGHYLFESTNTVTPDAIHVEGMNENYIFKIGSRAGRKDFYLEQLIVRDNWADENEAYRRFRLRSFHDSQTLKLHIHILWPLILESENLRILSSNVGDKGGRKTLELTFELTPSNAEIFPGNGVSQFELLPRIENAIATFWVDSCYVPLTFDGVVQAWNDEDPYRLRYVVEYHHSNDNLCLPSKRTSTIEIASKSIRVQHVDTYDFPNRLEVPPQSRFYLSAYGLPEPIPSRKRWPLGWIALVFAFVTAGGFLLIQVVKSRRNAQGRG